MAFHKKTIRDINLDGKTILLRADYNVPLNKEATIASDFRLRKSLPTLEYLIKKRCRVVICSHLGRPEGPHDLRFSLAPVAKRLGKLLDREVTFISETDEREVKSAIGKLKPGEVAMLENLRFHPEEEKNDPEFAKQLASLADIFVQDGFGVVHRAHASTSAITKLLPSVAGLLLEQEVETLTKAVSEPQRPLLAILGGAKIADKIDILKRFIEIADFVAVGGAMANTFLQAEGVETGDSLTDDDDIALAKDIIEMARRKSKQQQFIFYIPQDGVVAKSADTRAETRIVDWDAHVIADIESYPKRPPRNSNRVARDEMILDIGPFSGAFISGGIQLAKTVIWNGTMGVTEIRGVHGPVGPFAHGTDLIVDAMLGEYGNRPFTVVGGGDTASYVEERALTEQFNHVSTGGGASMELMSGKKLPGVEALEDK